MIGLTEVQSENEKRAQAETNRNAAIEGMFASAGAAVKAGSKIQGKLKTTTPGTPGTYANTTGVLKQSVPGTYSNTTGVLKPDYTPNWLAGTGISSLNSNN
jgi:hypothetical protein